MEANLSQYSFLLELPPGIKNKCGQTIKNLGGKIILMAKSVKDTGLVISNEDYFSRLSEYKKQRLETLGWKYYVNYQWIESLQSNQYSSFTDYLLNTTNGKMNQKGEENGSTFQPYEEDEERADTAWKVAKLICMRKENHIVTLEIHLKHPENSWESVPPENVRIFKQEGRLGSPFMDKKSYQHCPIEKIDDLFFKYFQELSKQDYLRVELASIPDYIGSYQAQIQLHFSNLSDSIKSLVNFLYEKAYASVSKRLFGLEIKHNVKGAVERFHGLIPSYDRLELLESILFQMLLSHQTESTHQIPGLIAQFLRAFPSSSNLKFESVKEINNSLEQIQLLKDAQNVKEGCSGNSIVDARYANINCSIHELPDSEMEYSIVQKLTTDTGKNDAKVLKIFKIQRQQELDEFDNSIQPQRLLYHGTKSSHLLGILNRGLLVPKRNDWDDRIKQTLPNGLLGFGIYFTDTAATALQYVDENESTAFLLIAQVALGSEKVVTDPCPSTIAPPPGYQSLHAIPSISGKFKDHEFCIYSTSQQKLMYLVQIQIGNKKDESLSISQADEQPMRTLIPSDYHLLHQTGNAAIIPDLTLLQADSKPSMPELVGLIANHGSQSFPLESIDCRVNIMDMIGEVCMFFKYKNTSSQNSECKFVFPLDDKAAVCRFEAFINEKHIVGVVKEKQQAKKEYNQAIENNQGAYLLDQSEESPDLWTMVVGNLPPNATVVILLAYVTELEMDEDRIVFTLPTVVNKLASKKLESKIYQNIVSTQAANTSHVRTQFSLVINVEMPYDITSIQSNHPVSTKQTLSKAVVRYDNNSLDDQVFLLRITQDTPKEARMWIERTKEGHYAAMVALFPKFNDLYDVPELLSESASQLQKKKELILLIDRSASMQGFLTLMKVAIVNIINQLPGDILINVVSFGSWFDYLLPISQPLDKVRKNIVNYISQLTCNYGSSLPYASLYSIYLLSQQPDRRKSVLLVTDGQFGDNTTSTIRLISENRHRARVFTIGIGSELSKHTVRSLSNAGAGCSLQCYDSKSLQANTFSKFVPKLFSPALSNIRINWQFETSNMGQIHSAPKEITSLFENERIFSYCLLGDVLCTSAVLHANIQREDGTIANYDTIVSTHELAVKRNSSLLHRLTAKAIIDDFEKESSCFSADKVLHRVIIQYKKSQIIEVSTQYQIASRHTSFLAVESRSKDEKFSTWDDKKLLHLIHGNFEELLPEISWTTNPQTWQQQQQVILPTDTDSDLRKLSLENAKTVLLKFGIAESVIDGLSRWQRIKLAREKLADNVANGNDPQQGPEHETVKPELSKEEEMQKNLLRRERRRLQERNRRSEKSR